MFSIPSFDSLLLKSQVPALFIRTCRFLHFDLNSLTQQCIDSNDERSQWITSMFLLSVYFIISSFVSFSLLSSIVVKTTVAPSAARPFAVSFPMPDVAPIIKTILPFKKKHPVKNYDVQTSETKRT
jgi:hypothetical protein